MTSPKLKDLLLYILFKEHNHTWRAGPSSRTAHISVQVSNQPWAGLHSTKVWKLQERCYNLFDDVKFFGGCVAKFGRERTSPKKLRTLRQWYATKKRIFSEYLPYAHHIWGFTDRKVSRWPNPVATGGFGGLTTPNKAPSSPQIKTGNTFNQWSFG